MFAHLNWLNCFLFFILSVGLYYSDRFNNFSVTISRCFKDVYVNSFFPHTAILWNSLPMECFPLNYDGSVMVMFILNSFPACFNLFVLLFLVTSCLIVAVQPCMEKLQLNKIWTCWRSFVKHTKCICIAVLLNFTVSQKHSKFSTFIQNKTDHADYMLFDYMICWLYGFDMQDKHQTFIDCLSVLTDSRQTDTYPTFVQVHYSIAFCWTLILSTKTCQDKIMLLNPSR